MNFLADAFARQNHRLRQEREIREMKVAPSALRQLGAIAVDHFRLRCVYFEYMLPGMPVGIPVWKVDRHDIARIR